MTACRYLEGENLMPLTASAVRKLIGKKVEYLTTYDIDKSGRGYFYPRVGVIEGAQGRNIIMENQNYVYRSDIREMRLIEEKMP